MSSSPPLSWDRLPDETAKAYQAFSIYRGLGSQARSVDEAYHRYRGYKTATRGQRRAPGYFARWSIRHNWANRIRAWDAHLESEQRRQDCGVWLARQRELRETEWTVAGQLIERAQILLRWPLQEERLDRDGQTIIVKPTRWRLRDAEALLATASRLQRLSSGLATSHNELSGPDRQPLLEPEPLIDLSALSDEELAAFTALLRKAREGSEGADETPQRLYD